MVKTETHIFGIYPKTEELRKNLNRWERGKLETSDISKSIEQEKEKYFDLVSDCGISSYTDPLFNWYDILRPVVLLSGGKLGPLTRYKESNTFYRLPEFETVENVDKDPTKFSELESNPPLPLYQGADKEGFSAFLPSPITLYRMSNVSADISRDAFIERITGNYVEFCSRFRVKNVTIFEAFEYNGDDLSFLDKITQRHKLYLITEGELQEETFRNISYKPHSIVTQGDENAKIASLFADVPGIKVIDAHNTRMENPGEIKSRIEDVAGKYDFESVVLANSDYLDFLPRKIADRKVEVLSKVGE